jgi:CDP-paratose 2-epimerase
MRILITGACGFVGSTLARTWSERGGRQTLFGLDNLSRPGSEINRPVLRAHGVTLIHADVRLASDVDGSAAAREPGSSCSAPAGCTRSASSHAFP